MKKLYFVKMGMDYKNEGEMEGSDVGNYRIRGTFHDKDGNIIFIEFGRGYIRDEKGKTICNIALRIDHQFNTTEDWDENKSHIKIDYEKLKSYRYTKADILKYIENEFGVKFDELELIDVRYCGYDYKEITGDEYTPDYEYINQVKKIEDYFRNYEKNIEGKKYVNFSIYHENDELIVVKHYNQYNDVIVIDDIYNFDFDYKIPYEEIAKAQ